MNSDDEADDRGRRVDEPDDNKATATASDTGRSGAAVARADGTFGAMDNKHDITAVASIVALQNDQ
jgi:hypothetical protein